LPSNDFVDQKCVTQAISTCLENKDEFRVEIIKDAFGKLMLDDILSDFLVRTAIIAYQYHSELKSYLLLEMVPSLFRKSSWSTYPKLWEGVVYIINKLYNHKDAEVMIKCILSLPTHQLKNVIVAAPLAKDTILNSYRSLNEDGRREILSGHFINLNEVINVSEKESYLSQL
jgi:hypothetical protein